MRKLKLWIAEKMLEKFGYLLMVAWHDRKGRYEGQIYVGADSHSRHPLGLMTMEVMKQDDTLRNFIFDTALNYLRRYETDKKVFIEKLESND